MRRCANSPAPIFTMSSALCPGWICTAPVPFAASCSMICWRRMVGRRRRQIRGQLRTPTTTPPHRTLTEPAQGHEVRRGCSLRERIRRIVEIDAAGEVRPETHNNNNNNQLHPGMCLDSMIWTFLMAIWTKNSTSVNGRQHKDISHGPSDDDFNLFAFCFCSSIASSSSSPSPSSSYILLLQYKLLLLPIENVKSVHHRNGH